MMPFATAHDHGAGCPDVPIADPQPVKHGFRGDCLDEDSAGVTAPPPGGGLPPPTR